MYIQGKKGTEKPLWCHLHHTGGAAVLPVERKKGELVRPACLRLCSLYQALTSNRQLSFRHKSGQEEEETGACTATGQAHAPHAASVPQATHSHVHKASELRMCVNLPNDAGRRASGGGSGSVSVASQLTQLMRRTHPCTKYPWSLNQPGRDTHVSPTPGSRK